MFNSGLGTIVLPENMRRSSVNIAGRTTNVLVRNVLGFRVGIGMTIKVGTGRHQSGMLDYQSGMLAF